MKLITRDTDYAVRALCCISGSRERLVSVRGLITKLKIPKSFLRKILQILNKKGLLKSYKGKGGGFALALSPHNIFLLDVIEVFQGQAKLNECMFKKKTCPNVNICLLKKKLDSIEKYVMKELKSITIASLLKKGVTDA